MSLVPPIVKTTFVKRIQDLKAQSTDATATNKATARLVGNQKSEGIVRGFTLVQDEPESVAGTGTGPTPTDYLIASVAFCENVVFARNAALNDLDIQALETTASGDWDMKGLFEIGTADPSFRSILVETRVMTTGPIRKAVEVARMTHRRCPVHATLKKATKMTFRLFVNDVEASL
ncbi:MAG TPA: OsmC family protein [Candidatus Binatus sp.]|nr:OsmC family protein [Candidatus Binatus sp.]